MTKKFGCREKLVLATINPATRVGIKNRRGMGQKAISSATAALLGSEEAVSQLEREEWKREYNVLAAGEVTPDRLVELFGVKGEEWRAIGIRTPLICEVKTEKGWIYNYDPCPFEGSVIDFILTPKRMNAEDAEEAFSAMRFVMRNPGFSLKTKMCERCGATVHFWDVFDEITTANVDAWENEIYNLYCRKCKPATTLEKTGLKEKTVRRILHRLEKRGLVKVDGDIACTTSKGDKIVKSLKLYGYPATTAVRDVLKVRDWANENRGKTVSFDDVKALNLTIHNKKVGRILTVLGCKRMKKHGEIYYQIPAELEKMQLRDLTRTKRGHLANQREKWTKGEEKK